MAGSKKKKKKIPVKTTAGTVILIILALFTADRWLAGTRNNPSLPGTGGKLAFDGPMRREVIRVIDGDTIVVTGNQKVRLIGVDALEIHKGKRLEGQAGRLGIRLSRALKWGRKARDFAADELHNASVELRPGYERFDKYGRLLAYVWYKPPGATKMFCFNKLLLEEGYALATRRFRHPERSRYIALEAEAKRKRKGLWAYATK